MLTIFNTSELWTKLLVWGKCPSPNLGDPLSVLQVLNTDYGVSVLGGPLSVTKVPWAASKFKGASYSVHLLIWSANLISPSSCWVVSESKIKTLQRLQHPIYQYLKGAFFTVIAVWRGPLHAGRHRKELKAVAVCHLFRRHANEMICTKVNKLYKW